MGSGSLRTGLRFSEEDIWFKHPNFSDFVHIRPFQANVDQRSFFWCKIIITTLIVKEDLANFRKCGMNPVLTFQERCDSATIFQITKCMSSF